MYRININENIKIQDKNVYKLIESTYKITHISAAIDFKLLFWYIEIMLFDMVSSLLL